MAGDLECLCVDRVFLVLATGSILLALRYEFIDTCKDRNAIRGIGLASIIRPGIGWRHRRGVSHRAFHIYAGITAGFVT